LNIFWAKQFENVFPIFSVTLQERKKKRRKPRMQRRRDSIGKN
jgi:hypothetical protein